MKTFYKIRHGYLSKCFNTLFNKKNFFIKMFHFFNFARQL